MGRKNRGGELNHGGTPGGPGDGDADEDTPNKTLLFREFRSVLDDDLVLEEMKGPVLGRELFLMIV
ncbi:hypothetical protein EYF80_047931 [Liparis tanakae]|uniref:Uncharacterized protein n=1 Tax=Liparis tanakae TaxID=230148 RepID=A0A4Z2FKX9_9TELE|nr:hypothetical protein EYF80_047931 [Liparis tanakae]